MSDNFDQKQFDRVKHKLLYMNRVSPALVNLNAPWGQLGANTAYPEDYWKIVTEVADGGTLPPFLLLDTGVLSNSQPGKPLPSGNPFH